MDKQFAELESRADRAFLKTLLVVVIAVPAVACLFSLVPSRQQACTETCAEYGKLGMLVHADGLPRLGMRDPGPTECVCKTYRPLPGV